ncbi:MAG: hypothetical protein ACLRWF_07965 [Ruthenibacterium sp.]
MPTCWSRPAGKPPRWRSRKAGRTARPLAPWLGLDVPLCTASTPDMLVQFGTSRPAGPWKSHPGRTKRK